MKEVSSTSVLQLFCGCDDLEYLVRNLARVIVPGPEQEDSLWDLTNRICDRYMCPIAA
jgi:hypothetical protein